jgi:hypothetical protein
MSKKDIGGSGLSSFQQELLKAMTGSPGASKKSPGIRMMMTDPFMVGAQGGITKDEAKEHDKNIGEINPLVKSVLNVLNGPGDSIERLAFESNPSMPNTYQSLWKRKLRLLPDDLLKRIAIQDDLVAAIVNTRSAQVAAFGRPQPDRFSTGFRIEPEPGHTEKLDADQKEKLQDRIAKLEAKLLTCGNTEGWNDQESLGFGQFLFMSARNAVIVGRMATEMIWVGADQHDRKFHSFRPIDAGTIYRAAPYKHSADVVRTSALRMLETLKNKKLTPEKYIADEYSWVQVIDYRPVQAFTAEECLVHNFYPTTDVELDGYPITPLDTVITAVTTHLNINTHNKLYFQAGRASRGMLVIKSDDADETAVAFVRQQFNASINSVGNAWRMPVFGVGSEEDISWVPIDNSSRDMEFQYLSDTNARVILSAFQMSPEELPGYAHLSRGTNSQALSESNTEYKLTAARDVGIRPLLSQFQNFVNARLLPLLDEELSQFCSFKFVGLDAETAEKESVRLQQDMAVHMVMDEVLEKVEKNPLGMRWGGRYPLNPQWQQAIAPFLTVGEQLEHFFGVENASKNPELQYYRDPMWFQWKAFQQQEQQMQMQQQAQEQQAQAQQQQGQQQQQEGQGELDGASNQLAGALQKGEINLTQGKKKLLVHQNKVVSSVMAGLQHDADQALKEILEAADSLLPDKLKT